MTKHTRELLGYLLRRGVKAEHVGMDGRDHVRLRLSNGKHMSVPLTPRGQRCRHYVLLRARRHLRGT